ncbi:hypothetical protein Tco_0705790 [Tanacetum coccineum]|uniref:Uncharacterized protein n=1 Tax=Tanacetum coccineum TaxID=301880 RepID=A0ABQ4Y5N9_9ASTR
MESKDNLSSCSDLEEQEIQKLQMQAKIFKENSLNELNALKSTTQLLFERQHITQSPLFQQAFAQLFGDDVRTFKFQLSQHMNDLETQLNAETLHEMDSKSALSKKLQRLHSNERQLQIQQYEVQQVQSSVTSSGDETSSGIVSDEGNDQSLENQSNTSGDTSSRSGNDAHVDDEDIRPIYDEEPLVEVPNTAEYNVFADERAALANLIANLTLDTEENKTILRQLKKANASLTQELEKCKTNLDETNSALNEATSCRDSCLIALQNKQTELEKYIAFNDRTIDYEILQTKLNETLGLLALKDIEIKEGLKTKAYEISVLNQKHNELVKTKSELEGRLKEKTKVIWDLNVKEGKDIDKMIEMDKQLKFLNEIVYKRNQSIQTIHMLAPRCSTYNGRPTFANPKYLKKAQSEKPCLYEIPYDTSDLANRFAPDREETMTLETESRSKLNKDKVKPYDYTKQNSLYEIFKTPSLEYLYQLERAKEVRKTMWRNCVSKDVICSYLHSLSDLNAHTGLQCLYLHKVKECECLAQKLSKQTESVNKEVHNNLLKSFSKLEKHSISLELALQQCKEQMKNNSVCKENGSNVFRKEREQYHEIQDLKAQMQDKNIAISELKKLIENCKGKSVETQFDKPSVVRQPNAQRIPKPSVLGKPTPFSNSPEMRSFQTKQSVNKTNVSDGLFKQVTQQNLPKIRKQAVRNTNVIAPGPSRNHPKHVSFQSPKEFVGSNDMVHNYYLEKAKKSAQLQKDKDVNGKPSMINPARLPNTANGCKPKPRNWQASMSSRVSNKDVHIEGEHRKQKPFLKSNDLRCPTCKKCLFSANHDECVLEYLSKLNPRASAQNKDAKSHKTTKRYMPVEKTRESKRPERQIPSGHRFSKKKTTTVLEKTMTPRSCLRWKQTGKIFKTVGLRWVPTGKLFNSCTGKVDSEPTHGSIVDIPHIHACKQTLGLSAGTSFNGQKQQRIDLNADALYNVKQENLRVWLLKMLISKKPVPECSGLVLHQMTSDHNRSELEIHDHSNESSSSKLVPKVVPPVDKKATSRQELELLFHHHIAMLRTTGLSKWKFERGVAIV